ncbi:MAG: deoxyribose-phosphate aldolase [Mycoplasma sp.]
MELSKYIDHTLLRADASEQEIIQLCKEAKQYNFKSVCVNPSYIPLAKQELKGSDVLVCTVIGFPLGQMTTNAKVSETKDAINIGADEVDMVINIAKLKAHDLNYVTNEIKLIKQACGNKVLKVIVETCLLNDQQKIDACHCVMNAKADFIKTSTGFSTSGATVHDVELFKKTVGDKILIKAAGGVKNKDDFHAMIKAGANRIGTSRGVELFK